MPRTKKEKTSREPCLGQANRKRLTELINSDGLTAIIRGFCVYAKTLDELRYKEEQIKKG